MWDGIVTKVRRGPSLFEVAAEVLLFFLLVFATSTVFVREAWAVQTFQIGVYSLLSVALVFGSRDAKGLLAGDWLSWLVCLIPLWGIFQLVAHTTSASFDTRREVLKWGSLAAVFFLSKATTRTGVMRRYFFDAYLGFACCMAVLCITQLTTSHGKVLWIFPTGYPDVYATFPNQNNYAQFVELALPIALWKAIREGWRAWWYALACALLYASAIASASRAGAALCSAEVVAVIAIEAVRARRMNKLNVSRASIAFVLLIPVLAAAFTFAVGWQRLSDRFQGGVTDSTRKSFVVAGVKMVSDRPLTGYGLGTFPTVYPSYAEKTFPFYANHAHNDWVEFAAEGGIPFLLLVLLPLTPVVFSFRRTPAAVGLLAVMLHACVDYPFPRPAVSGWIYALLGCAYATSESRKLERDISPGSSTLLDGSES